MSRPLLEVADIICNAGESFLEKSRCWITRQHRKILLAILRRGTAVLGGHRDRSSDCGNVAISYNSCGNWHCPPPQIYYALPENPELLFANRSRGILFRSQEEAIAESVRKRERAKEPDALEYLYRTLCQLTELAARLLARSPLAPQPLVLGKDDIIGEIKVI